MDWLLTIVITFIGVALAMVRSTWIVDFTAFVFVFNRELRRLVDYFIHHEFTPINPISLTPLLVAGAMVLPSLFNIHRLPKAAFPVVACFFLAIAYAFAIGYARLKMAAVFALAEAIAPLGLFAFVLLVQPDTAVKDRWFRSFAWAAILASAYGWYQYLTMPKWDAFWLVESGMMGYMGIPEPTLMAVCGPMAERSVLAGYLGFCVVPMIVSRRWRTRLGWPAVLLVFSTILLTMNRSGLILAVIATVAYVFINRGKGAEQLAFAVLFLGVGAWVGMERIPNSDRITKRYETLGEMQEDSSYKGRLMIMSYGPTLVARNPLGLGLGSSGMAGRVNSGGKKSTAEVVDAGYFNVILSYGIPGALCLLAALLLAWQVLSARFRQPELVDEHVFLARAMMITLIPASFVGDVLTGFSIFWLALGCGIAIPITLRRAVLVGAGIHPVGPRPGRGGGGSVAAAPARKDLPGQVEPDGETPTNRSPGGKDAEGFWLRE